ncbi:MAG: hypothetical protein P4L42_14870 [Desulfocapsaceae bacterium]|nr:hypothetical protein [Desulfocapsaceae bacterium]
MTIDWTGVVTAVTGMISPAVTAALPIGGSILAIGVAWRLFKHFTR